MDGRAMIVKARTLILCGIGVVLVVAGAVAVYLTRKDRGMLRTEECAAALWPPERLPLFVVAGDAEIESDTLHATNFWQAVLPHSFLYAGLDPLADSVGTVLVINPVDADPDRPRAHARPVVDGRCHILRVPIDLPWNTPASVRERVIAHELGHALGLDDDDGPESSVMYRRALDEAFEVTAADAALLRGIYPEPGAAP